MQKSVNEPIHRKERDACFQDASTQTEEPFAPLFDEIAMKLAVEKDAEQQALQDMEYQKKRNVEIMEEFEHELKKQESDFDSTRQRNEDRRDKIRKLEGKTFRRCQD